MENHFVAILCGADPSFPLYLWSDAELILNLTRPSMSNLNILAWEMLNGPYVFDRTPIAPVGTRVVVLENPLTRGSWATHGEDGCYVGPAFSHYREYRLFVKNSQAFRTTNSLSWNQHQMDDVIISYCTSIVSNVSR